MAYLKSCFLPYNCIIYTFSHLAKAIRATTMGMLERHHVKRRARTNHPPTQQTLNTTKHTHAVLAPARAHENTRTHTITQSLEYVRDSCIKQSSSYEADHPARTHRTCALHKIKALPLTHLLKILKSLQEAFSTYYLPIYVVRILKI